MTPRLSHNHLVMSFTHSQSQQGGPSAVCTQLSFYKYLLLFLLFFFIIDDISFVVDWCPDSSKQLALPLTGAKSNMSNHNTTSSCVKT